MIDENPHSELPTHSENPPAALPAIQDVEAQVPARRSKRAYGPVIALIMLAIASFVGFRIYQNLTASARREAPETSAVEA